MRVADVAALNVCKPLCSRLALVSVPKVGLEPTPSCEDRILSPVRLPYTWYWKHVAVTLKGFGFKAVTMPP